MQEVEFERAENPPWRKEPRLHFTCLIVDSFVNNADPADDKCSVELGRAYRSVAPTAGVTTRTARAFLLYGLHSYGSWDFLRWCQGIAPLAAGGLSERCLFSNESRKPVGEAHRPVSQKISTSQNRTLYCAVENIEISNQPSIQASEKVASTFVVLATPARGDIVG